MKKNKFNPQLLSEELKRFRLLSEYTFITGDEKKPLILGDENIDEADEAPSDAAPEDDPSQPPAPAPDAGQAQGGEDPNADLAGQAQGGEENTGMEQQPMDQPMDQQGMEQPSDEVEVDVTSLVKGSEEAKDAADKASKNTKMLLKKLEDLESRVANMAVISDKIEGLEKEIIKRNPTPVEKLEMRSLDSYPFNQKLTDYWSDKEGMYNVMDNKPKEYILTKDDVNHSFSDSTVKNSFNIKESYTEENITNFEEEDI